MGRWAARRSCHSRRVALLMHHLPADSAADIPAEASLFETLFALSLTGVLLLRPLYAAGQAAIADLAYVRLNPAAQRLLGLPDQPDTTLLTRFPHVADSGLFAFYCEAFQSGQPRRCDVCYQHEGRDAYLWLAAQRSGDYLVVSLSEASRQAFPGAPAHLAPASPASPHQQFEALFWQAPVAIAMLSGPHHVCVFANASFQALAGRRPLMGHSLPAMLADIVGAGFLRRLDEVYQSGQPFLSQEAEPWLSDHPTGEVRPTYFTLACQPTHDAQGAVDGVLVFAYDSAAQAKERQHLRNVNAELVALNVELSATGQALSSATSRLADAQQQLRHLTHTVDTQVQERTESLAATNRQLTQVNRDLDYFIYSASHDLRAPIANLEGLLLALDSTLPPDHALRPDVQPLLTMMYGAVRRFHETITHLTEISLVSQETALPATPVNLAELIADVQLDLAPLVTHYRAEIVVDVANCPPLRLSAKHLRSIVFNLLSNALKYHHPGRVPQVRIWCRTTGAATELSVQDNGLGLSAAQQAQLFRLFQRLHYHVEGSGVGLFLIKKMVENAGGTLTVQSQVDIGSTFTVSIPT